MCRTEHKDRGIKTEVAFDTSTDNSAGKVASVLAVMAIYFG